jgi:hypothetical protein
MGETPMPPEFLPGVELSRGLYDDVLVPILGATPHAAARIGWGSDVLGFDDERSTDHGWGPRAQIFVRPEDVPAVAARIEAALPEHYRGWPVRFGWDDVAIQHHVEVATLGPWLEQRLGLDPLIGIETADWLMLPQQRRGDRGRRLPRPGRRARSGSPQTGVVPARRLALATRLRLAPARARGGLRRSRRRSWRHPRFATDRRPPGARADAVGVPARAALRALLEVAG